MTVKDLMRVRKQTRVLVVGDIMLDRYTMCRAPRISQEAPVPVVLFDQERFVLGGAGNVAANLAAMEVNVELVGVVGKDHYGKFTKDLIRTTGIGDRNVIVDKKRPTTIKQRVTAGQQIVRIDRESLAPIQPHQVLELAKGIESRLRLQKIDAVIVSDYGKGVVTRELMGRIATACHNSAVFLGMNGRPANLRAIPDSLDVLIVNRKEACEIGQIKDEGDMDSVKSAATSIYHMHHPKIVCVTLGGDGILLYARTSNGRMHTHVPTTPSEVIDVSGCGDTVVTYFILGAALGFDPKASAQLANKAAGVVVKKFGTSVVLPAELEAA